MNTSMKNDVRENQISQQILDSAIEVHRTLGGPGLLERVYEEALTWELRQRGLHVDRQLCVPIMYKSIFEAQALTYLRLMNLRLAVVINFGEKYVKNGYHRVVHHL